MYLSGLYVQKQNNRQFYLVYDVLNRRGWKTGKLEYMRLMESEAVVCEGGLAFPNRTILRAIGKEGLGNYLRAREIYCDSFRFKHFSHPEFELEGINELLEMVGEKKLTERDFHLPRFQLRAEKQRLSV